MVWMYTDWDSSNFRDNGESWIKLGWLLANLYVYVCACGVYVSLDEM